MCTPPLDERLESRHFKDLRANKLVKDTMGFGTQRTRTGIILLNDIHNRKSKVSTSDVEGFSITQWAPLKIEIMNKITDLVKAAGDGKK